MARGRGKEAAAKVGAALVTKVVRPLGEKAAAAASRAARERGYAGPDLSLDEVLARLKAMRDSGELSLEEFLRRREEILAFMRGKGSN